MLSPFLLSPELAYHCLTYTTPLIDFPIVHIYHYRLAGGARASFNAASVLCSALSCSRLRNSSPEGTSLDL